MHPALFPADATSDQPETFYVAEMIREKIFLLTREEVPYAVAVRVDEMTERKRPGAPLHRRDASSSSRTPSGAFSWARAAAC